MICTSRNGKGAAATLYSPFRFHGAHWGWYCGSASVSTKAELARAFRAVGNLRPIKRAASGAIDRSLGSGRQTAAAQDIEEFHRFQASLQDVDQVILQDLFQRGVGRLV